MKTPNQYSQKTQDSLIWWEELSDKAKSILTISMERNYETLTSEIVEELHEGHKQLLGSCEYEATVKDIDHHASDLKTLVPYTLFFEDAKQMNSDNENWVNDVKYKTLRELKRMQTKTQILINELEKI